MQQDDTLEPSRHHSNTTMPPPHVNRVAQAEHEQRDSHLSVVSHTEDAEEKGRRVVLGLPE